MENIFRTTLAHSYAKGQKAVVSHDLVRSVAVIAEMAPIFDSRLTNLCRVVSESGIMGADGKRTAFFMVDDPIFREYCAPRHFQCRCSTLYHSVERASQRGLPIAKEWLKTGIRPDDSELFVPRPPVELPPGWVSVWQG